MKLKGVLLFRPADVSEFLGRTKIAVRFLIHRLNKKGDILRLKPGLYRFADAHIPDVYLANKIYEPSYVSLEYALSYHQLIPEVVYEITSVTTRTTRKFEVAGKIFSFRSIKQDAFTGYFLETRRSVGFFIAEPEKAVVDWVYLHGPRKPPDVSRLRKEKLNRRKIFAYAALFKKTWLSKILKTIFP